MRLNPDSFEEEFSLDHLSECEKFISVSSYGKSIRYFSNPSVELIRAAISDDPHAIKYIENPSDEIKYLAVQGSSYAIQNIPDASEELKRLAVAKNGYAIRFINNPSLEFIKSILDNMNPNTYGYKSLEEFYTEKYMSENNISAYK